MEWKQLLVVSGIFGTVIFASTTISAQEIAEVNQLSQVTSVSQLSDVQATDWAFQALQSLVERYGCIAGYKDSVFRGSRAISRDEFAAGLNACLNRVNELIAKATADLVKKSDLETLQRLQSEFKAELATLRGRVDAVEAKTAELKANQFSTTTKLEGEAIFAVTDIGTGSQTIRNSNTTPGVSPSGDINPAHTANPTVVARVRLNLLTSFTGKDLLYTQLQSGNGGQTAAIFGQDPGLGGSYRFNTFDLDYAGVSPEVVVNYLYYKFPLGRDLQASIGPGLAVNDYVDGNSYTNDEAVNFSSTFFKNNPLLFPASGAGVGAGAALLWNPGGGAFSLRGAYVAGAGNNPSKIATNDRGLFGDPYQGTVELEFAPKLGDAPGPVALRLQYTSAKVNQRDISIGALNAEWAISPKLGLFGRYGFGSITGEVADSFSGFAQTTFNGKTLSPATWSAGLALTDLLMRGSRAAVAVGQPFIESNVGNSTQTNVEAFYRIPINENIAITPDIQLIFNLNNNSANDTITVGTIRTTFKF
ncbi:MAG: carbohydrate porin [Nostocaceae cyanobacterium]|nr:carbohydrate porin [Nostocaceae cyanobacterium]